MGCVIVCLKLYNYVVISSEVGKCILNILDFNCISGYKNRNVFLISVFEFVDIYININF